LSRESTSSADKGATEEFSTEFLDSGLGSLFVALQVPSFAQGVTGKTQKTFLIDQPAQGDPIKVVKVMEGTTELQQDAHRFPSKYAWESVFNADEDWLKRLSLVIENVSSKRIVFLAAGCHLYETADWPSEIAREKTVPGLGETSNIVGRRLQQALYSASLRRWLEPDTKIAPFSLPPGQTFNFPVEDPGEYPALRSRIEQTQPISTISARDASISQVFFEDGTKWEGHRYKRADPDRPGRWIQISFQEWEHDRPVARATQP
jgi:hypothetical protein